MLVSLCGRVGSAVLGLSKYQSDMVTETYWPQLLLVYVRSVSIAEGVRGSAGRGVDGRVREVMHYRIDEITVLPMTWKHTVLELGNQPSKDLPLDYRYYGTGNTVDSLPLY